MIYRILADLTVGVHFAYVTFVFAGLWLTLLGRLMNWQWVRNRWFRGIHLAMILVVVLEAWIGMTCPLTTWEREFREAAGQESYRGDFLANWFHDATFVQAPSWLFTFAYTLFGVLVLAALLLVRPTWRLNKGQASTFAANSS